MAKIAGSTRPVKPRARPPRAPESPGAWPILEPLLEEDEAAVVNTAAGLDEGLTETPRNQADDLTPDTLLGDHRDGKWAAREDEDDRSIN